MKFLFSLHDKVPRKKNIHFTLRSAFFYSRSTLLFRSTAYVCLRSNLRKICNSKICYRNPFNGDMYEPPTRLRDTQIISTPVTHVIRRGSASSNDYSETYHTTTRNDDPLRPSVTNTVQSFSKKVVPSRDGRGMETIESTERKSITKSRYVSGDPSQGKRYYESERKYINSGSNPVVIEVRNNYRN